MTNMVNAEPRIRAPDVHGERRAPDKGREVKQNVSHMVDLKVGNELILCTLERV